MAIEWEGYKARSRKDQDGATTRWKTQLGGLEIQLLADHPSNTTHFIMECGLFEGPVAVGAQNAGEDAQQKAMDL